SLTFRMSAALSRSGIGLPPSLEPLLRLTRRRPSSRAPRTEKPPARLGLACRRPAALAAGSLLLRRRPTLRAAAPARARVRLLAAAARRTGRVRDPGRALLRHALVLQGLVLLLVLDAWSLSR